MISKPSPLSSQTLVSTFPSTSEEAEQKQQDNAISDSRPESAQSDNVPPQVGGLLVEGSYVLPTYATLKLSR